ncbi:MAG: hypothetical protein Q9207_003908 [Kuettlingeria erythrocarpa]
MGYMHRDIHLKNFFLLSVDPVEAALRDFGKAIKEQRSSDPYIGPIPTCAPEVNVEEERSYDNKIDIFSFGLAMAQALVDVLKLGGRVTQMWHKDVLRQLQQLARLGGRERDVAQLVTAMLEWDPAKRPSASAALAHPCFSPRGRDRRPPSSAQEPDLRHKAVAPSHQESRQSQSSSQEHSHRRPSGYIDPRPEHLRPGQQGYAPPRAYEDAYYPQQQMQEPLLPRPDELQPPTFAGRDWYKGPSSSDEKSTSSSSGRRPTPWVPLANFNRHMPPYNPPYNPQ